jgi:endonuclease G
MRYIGVFFFFLIIESCFSNVGKIDTISPLKKYYPSTNADTIIEHKFYTVSYSFKNKNPEWTIYEYKENNNDIRRNNNFSDDPATKNTASNNDYLKSGYDKGHLVPAEDMDFNEESMNESFYLTNVSPQNPNLNRGIWKKLENQIREWGKTKKLIIITGTIISKNSKKLGNNVKIPTHFYKVIINQKTNEIYCYLFPNVITKENLENYKITLKELENKTKLDFKE